MSIANLLAPSSSEVLKTARRWEPAVAPAYPLVQYAWTKAVGLTVLRVRLLSVAFGVMTLASAFLLAKKLGGARTGIFAMFLLGVSPIHIYYSLEIRNYAMTALLGMLSLLTLVHAVERPGRPIWAVNFAVDLLLIMSHLLASLLFVPQALFLLLCHRRRGVLGPWMLSHAVIAVAAAAWIGTSDLKAMHDSNMNNFPVSWMACCQMRDGLMNALYSWDASALIGDAGFLGTVLTGMFAVALLAVVAQRSPLHPFSAGGEKTQRVSRHHGLFLLGLAVVVPPVLLAALSLGYAKCFNARYAICSAVAEPVLLAGLVGAMRPGTMRHIVLAVLVVANGLLFVEIVQTRPQRRLHEPSHQGQHTGATSSDYLVLTPPSDSLAPAVDIPARISPKRIIYRQAWVGADFLELLLWHGQGIQVWVARPMEKDRDTPFGQALKALGLPFRIEVLRPDFYILYCIPVT